MEDRPYWWIPENNPPTGGIARLHQFPVTCETGPGSPSGHLMVTAAVWQIILSHSDLIVTKLFNITLWVMITYEFTFIVMILLFFFHI
jgi:glucose-6-phosphatase